MRRRTFLTSTTALGLGAALPTTPYAHERKAPEVLVRRAVDPIVIADSSGYKFKNGGPRNAVEEAFLRIERGEDVLDALIAGVNIPELDPEETGIGYGGLPNELGVVQLDASCMHGPRRQAGGVAALEGIRTPSKVAKAVMELTDHHLLVGRGAQEFARKLGFTVEEDLNTERSRALWLEWKRRVDPEHYPDPESRRRVGYEAGLDMVREGLLDGDSFWGTINCNGLGPDGSLCGVTTTSGLAWKIPGRVGDSPILGAGLYVADGVGAAGSTGRGEANLYNLSSFLIVEQLRQGMHPKDAGMFALRRIQENTVESRLLNDRGLPAFDIRFFVIDAQGRHAGVALYGSGESTYALCTAHGSEAPRLEGLLEGSPLDR
ncbi:MAG: N(4)-(beta-N-acetylglucosaminyl)-L-asparaginase [Gemmatimonadota bacterium]